MDNLLKLLSARMLKYTSNFLSHKHWARYRVEEMSFLLEELQTARMQSLEQRFSLQPPLDYEKLLRKYIKYVFAVEGTVYCPTTTLAEAIYQALGDEEFTPKEIFYLDAITTLIEEEEMKEDLPGIKWVVE